MRLSFRDREVTSSVFWAVVGMLFCIGGTHYGLRRSGIPGPGFLPFVAGLTLVALSLILLISRLLSRGADAGSMGEPIPSGQALKRVLQALSALCFYALAVERLGFAFTTFLFMVVVLWLGPRKWTFVLPAAFGATAFFFLLFKVLLNVPLPAGILGY